ncbi:MAG TPA: FkbM family methyltransferase [Pyrinomonadaceae bacterium]
MSSEIVFDNKVLAEALAVAGRDENLRQAIFEALRRAEASAEDPALFREQVRWPLILSLLSEAKTHRIQMRNGLVFEVAADSRIEQALLLSSEEHPDHVWEPQTTKLLTALARETSHSIVGGAYIGDQVLFLARAASEQKPPGVIHAFEPMKASFERLLQNLRLNNITNVVANRMGLWEEGNVRLTIEGDLGLASSQPAAEGSAESEAAIESISIDVYARSQELPTVGLIMLDTEGGEEKALIGARKTISVDKPNIIVEINRHFIDWTDGLENTSIIRFLTSFGYSVFAIRDFHSNYPMANRPIEIIPADRVYLEGPPHGFNVLATTDPGMIERHRLRIVEDVSPKLLLHKDPALHHPRF